MVIFKHFPKNTPSPPPPVTLLRGRTLLVSSIGSETSRVKTGADVVTTTTTNLPAVRMRGRYCAPPADDQSRPFNSITRDRTGRRWRCAELIKPKWSGRFRCVASRCFNYSKVITRALNRIWPATSRDPAASDRPGTCFWNGFGAPDARDYSWKVIGNKLEFHRAR